jgi:hypothetical protein
MSEGNLQLVGLGLLFAGVAAVWIFNVRRGIDLSAPAQKLYLLLAAFTIVGGFVGSTAWWIDHPASFAWDLPPLASRLLAAAALAFGVSGFAVLLAPTRAHVRYHALMIAIYLAPLAVMILLVHLDRFDLSAPITPAFFAVVVPMVLASQWLLAFPVGLVGDPSGIEAPPPAVVSLLRVVAIVFGIWGVALFVTDQGPWARLWVWPDDLLTSRLIAVMPLTLAATAIASMRSSLLAHTTLILIAVYGVAGSVAGLLNAAAGKPVPLLYVAAFAVFGVAAVAFLLRGRRATK